MTLACNCHAIPGEQHLTGCPLRVQPFRLRCPKCLDSMAADRDEHDPADATVMEIICPHCDDGDRHAPRYFRCDGSELLFGRDFGFIDAQGIETRSAETAGLSPKGESPVRDSECAPSLPAHPLPERQ